MERDIYRFVDFYELYDLLNNNKLKMSLLSLMSDINEGLGEVLKLQEQIYSWEVRTEEQFINFHEQIRASTYISSWTSEPDLMAMWLLYSKNRDYIRVKTTQSKLNKTLFDYWKSNSLLSHLNSPEGTLQLSAHAVVDKVDYVLFEDVSDSVKEKYREYYEILERGRNDEKIKTHLDLPELQELSNKIVIPVRYGSLLKDKAYEHEKEIRAFFNVSIRNGLSGKDYLEQCKRKSLLEPTTMRTPDKSELPNVLKISVSSDFIESISFDPRMPRYKKDLLLDVFSDYISLGQVEESYAIGYKPDMYNFSIKG